MLTAYQAKEKTKTKLESFIEDYFSKSIELAINAGLYSINFDLDQQHPAVVKNNEELVLKIFRNKGYFVSFNGNSRTFSWD